MSQPRPRPVAVVLLVTALVLAPLTACAGDDGAVLDVAAAASLTDVLTDLGERFEADTGVEVRLSFAGSSQLVTQLRAGAPFDVLVTADEETMARAVGGGDVGAPRVLARNRLQIAVEPGNPQGIAGLDDLARPGLLVVLCAPEVPCGRLGRSVLDRAEVALEPIALAENVKAVVSAVALGEADAGLVYASDVAAAGGGIDGVDLPHAVAAANEAVYVAAVAGDAGDPEVAAAFVDFLLSDAAQARLARGGFLPRS